MLAEIGENLIWRDLTAAQRAKLISRRKAAYEAVHPETKHGGAKGNVGGGKGKAKTIKAAKLASFEKDTARVTVRLFMGRPLRQVRPHRHRDSCDCRSRCQAAALGIMRPSAALRAGDHRPRTPSERTQGESRTPVERRRNAGVAATDPTLNDRLDVLVSAG